MTMPPPTSAVGQTAPPWRDTIRPFDERLDHDQRPPVGNVSTSTNRVVRKAIQRGARHTVPAVYFDTTAVIWLSAQGWVAPHFVKWQERVGRMFPIAVLTPRYLRG